MRETGFLRVGSRVLAAVALIHLFVAGQAQATDRRPDETFRVPAEFERHESLWMAWPTFQYTSEFSSVPVVVEMVRALERRVPVNMLVNSEEIAAEAQAVLESQNVPTDHITFRVIPYIDIWLRDMGPIFAVGDRGSKRVVDFGFNGWGLPDEYYAPEDLAIEEAVDRAVAENQELEVIASSLVTEGGNRELNGRGTMIAIEKTELQRNPGWTKAQIEAEYRRVLGISTVLWLEEGVIEDSPPTAGLRPGPDGALSAFTDGVEHVDEVARFSDPHTILLAEVTAEEARRDPIAAENRSRLERSYRILRHARDQEGRPFRIVRVPSAEILYETIDPEDGVYQWLSGVTFDDGTVFPWPEPVSLIAATGYMNFVLSNHVVLVARYWKPGMPEVVRRKDAQVVQLLRNAFPGREVVALDAMAINLGGGGMHCITQQEPVAHPR